MCILLLKIIHIKMGLTIVERECFRKAVKNYIVKNPNKKTKDIVEHFVQAGAVKSTVYNTLAKLAMPCPIQDKKRTDRPSSWTVAKKQKLK